jgi:hypothetical protein
VQKKSYRNPKKVRNRSRDEWQCVFNRVAIVNLVN